MTRTGFAALALLLATSALADDKPPADTGRYQVVRILSQVPAGPLMIDTTTGECWVEDTGRWTDLKFPAKDAKVDKGTVGRFALRVEEDDKGNVLSLAVWDTADGRCWRARYTPLKMTWQALPSPRAK